MSVLDGPGEGTWSVFAQKVVEERDALKEVVQTLKARLVDAEQRLIDAECERDASRGMEKAAEMRAERLYKERERLTECNDAMREPMRKLRDAMQMPAQGEGYVVDSIIKERDEALRLLATRVEAKRLDEAQEENERLREAAKQAREALRDCLRSASTNRLVDVIGDAMTALEQAGVKP